MTMLETFVVRNAYTQQVTTETGRREIPEKILQHDAVWSY